MKKFKNTLLTLFFLAAPMFIFFGVIKPKIIESKEEIMISYLEEKGFSNIQMIDVNGWYDQATFTTNEGEITLRFTRNGCFQIFKTRTI